MNEIRGLNSWVPVPEGSDFPLQNLPFGIAAKGFCPPKVCTRIGDAVVDLSVLAAEGYFRNLDRAAVAAFEQSVLNDFIALGRDTWLSVRRRLQALFDEKQIP